MRPRGSRPDAIMRAQMPPSARRENSNLLPIAISLAIVLFIIFISLIVFGIIPMEVITAISGEEKEASHPEVVADAVKNSVQTGSEIKDPFPEPSLTVTPPPAMQKVETALAGWGEAEQRALDS